jgi:hypothetical protein
MCAARNFPKPEVMILQKHKNPSPDLVVISDITHFNPLDEVGHIVWGRGPCKMGYFG